MKKYQEFEINYYQDEDGVFTAEVPSIRGCVAWGKTLPEASATPLTPSRVALRCVRKWRRM
jgi:hypothetical protein